MKLVEHSGAAQGFESQLSLIPEKNIGLFICANTSSMPHSKSRVFMDKFINNLLSRLMPERIVKKQKAKGLPNMGSVDEPLEMFTGKYRFTKYPHTTIDKLALLMGSAPEIEIISNGDTLEIVEWKDKLVPISDLTFHSRHGRYLAFGRDTKGEITYFFSEAFSFQKLKWYEPVRFQIFWMGSIILILLSYILVSVSRKLFVRNKDSHLLKKVNFSLASFILLFIAVLACTLFTIAPDEILYGIPLPIKMALVIPFFIILLEFASVYLLAKAIKFKALGTFDIIYQSLIVITVLFFIPWLMYYNLIGYNY